MFESNERQILLNVFTYTGSKHCVWNESETVKIIEVSVCVEGIMSLQ